MIFVKAFTFNPVQENTYLMYKKSGSCCIIDPGCYFEEEKQELADFITKEGLKPDLLLNTHCHFDHVFGNQYVFDTWGLTPHIHPLEKPVLDRAAEAAGRWMIPFANYTGPVTYLEEGDQLEWAGETFSIFHVPGHSPGSVAFYHAKQGILFGGDVLFQGSVGRTDLPGGDSATLEASIQQKIYTLPPKTKVYPGHGLPTSVDVERRSNPFVKAKDI